MEAELSQLDCPSPNQPSIEQLTAIEVRPETKPVHHLAYTAKIQTHAEEMLIVKATVF